MPTTFLVVKNNAADTLNGAINNLVTSIVTNNSSIFPTSYPFDLTIDNEIVQVTNNNTGTNTLTVIRAQQGTSAASHSNGVAISLRITAKSIADLNGAVNALEDSPPFSLGSNTVLLQDLTANPLIGVDASNNVYLETDDGKRMLQYDGTANFFSSQLTIDQGGNIAMNGVIALKNTLTAPQIYENSDTTTGIYFPSSGVMHIDVATHNVMAFDSAGIHAKSFTGSTANIFDVYEDQGNLAAWFSHYGGLNINLTQDALALFIKAAGTQTTANVAEFRDASNNLRIWVAPDSSFNIKNNVGVQVFGLDNATDQNPYMASGGFGPGDHQYGFDGTNDYPVILANGVAALSFPSTFLTILNPNNSRNILNAPNGALQIGNTTDGVQFFGLIYGNSGQNGANKNLVTDGSGFLDVIAGDSVTLNLLDADGVTTHQLVFDRGVLVSNT